MKIRILALLIMSVILCSIFPCYAAEVETAPAVATDIVETAPPPAEAAAPTTEGSTASNTPFPGGTYDMLKGYEGIEKDLPNVSIDELGDRINRKGDQVIGFGQEIGRKFAVILFLVSGFVCALTWFGNHEKFWLGIGGFFISGALYVAFTYGASIVHMIGGFLITP